MCRKAIILFAASLLIASGQIVKAQQIIESVPQGGAWNDVNTWVGGQVPTSVDDAVIYGTVQVPLGTQCHNLTIEGTLVDIGVNCDSPGVRHLTVLGDIQNNGTITGSGYLYCTGFKLAVHGNITNNGTWTPSWVYLEGGNDQQIASSIGMFFETINEIISEKSGGNVVADGPLRLSCKLNLDNITELDMQGHDLELKGEGGIRKGVVNNAMHLRFSELAKLGTVLQEPLTIRGDSLVLHDRAAFEASVTLDGNVAVLDTMINQSNGAVNTVITGNLTNLGHIVNQMGGYQSNSQTIYGSAWNQGLWDAWRVRFSGSVPRQLDAGTITATFIEFEDTLRLMHSNAIPSLTPMVGAQAPWVEVLPGAELELVAGIAPAQMKNYGNVFWSSEVNCQANYDNNFYKAQLRYGMGCNVSLAKVETFGEQIASGTENGIRRFWRVRNAPLTWEDTLSRIILNYDEDILNGNEPTELKVFHSGNGGISWNQLDGSTVNVNTRQVTVLNAPAVGLYTMASNALGISEVRPTLDRIESDHAGQGIMTAVVHGSGFTASSLLTLVSGSTTLTPELLSMNGLGESIMVTFDFTDAPVAQYDVVVEIPGDTVMTLPAAFTVEPREEPAPFAHLSGREMVMLGRWQTYTVTYGNTSNIDARAVPMYLAFSNVAGLEVEFVDFQVTVSNYAVENEIDGLVSDLDIWIEVDTAFDDVNGAILYPLYIPNIPANSVQSIRFKVKSTEPMMIQLALQDPLFVNPFDPHCVIGVVGEGLVDVGTSVIPGVGCVWSVGKNVFKQADQYSEQGLKDIGSWMLDWAVVAVDCGINLSGIGAVAKGTAVLFANFYGYYTGMLDCMPGIMGKRNIFQIFSLDPNAKVGPSGYGTHNDIAYPEDMPYVIFFENIDAATAPAQTVTITDTLDTEVFDISSFRFGPMQFDTVLVQPDAGSATSIEHHLDLRPWKPVLLHIAGELDTLTGVVVWDFTTIDPFTGELTEDPLGGFLPPNVLSPEGEGSVSFFIRPKNGLAHGTVIDNAASIVFDVNAPILTDVWTNRLDLTAPESGIDGHEMVSAEEVSISWSGTDDGSGIRSYSLFVSENGEEWMGISFANDITSTAFLGQTGSTYEFFVVATDSVGNAEEHPAVPDFTITMEPDGVAEHAKRRIKVYPNPVMSGPIIIESDIWKEGTSLIIEVIDLSGRPVISEHLAASSQVSLDLSGPLSEGNYLLRVTDGQTVSITKVTILH